MGIMGLVGEIKFSATVFGVELTLSMTSHLWCSISSGFQPSMARAIKQSQDCAVIKES